MNFRAVALCAAALGLLTVFACSSSSDAGATAAAGNCPAAGSKACTNDNAITQAETDQCNQLKADSKCGSSYVDYLKCAGSNVVCGSDGKYDQTASAAKCQTQNDAYTKCVIGGSSSGGTDAGGGG